MEKRCINVSFQSHIVLGVKYQGVGNFKTIIKGCNRKRSLCCRQKTMSHVTASCYRSLNTVTEAGNLQKWVNRSGQAPIATDHFASSGEIRPEAVGATTNTVQPVLLFDC